MLPIQRLSDMVIDILASGGVPRSTARNQVKQAFSQAGLGFLSLVFRI